MGPSPRLVSLQGEGNWGSDTQGEAEIGVMHLQARDHWGFLEAREAGERHGVSRGINPADNLLSHSGFQNCEGVCFCCSKPTQLVVMCYGSPRRRIWKGSTLFLKRNTGVVQDGKVVSQLCRRCSPASELVPQDSWGISSRHTYWSERESKAMSTLPGLAHSEGW